MINIQDMFTEMRNDSTTKQVLADLERYHNIIKQLQDCDFDKIQIDKIMQIVYKP